MGLSIVEIVLSPRYFPLYFDPNCMGTEMWDERDGCPLYQATCISLRSRAYMCWNNKEDTLVFHSTAQILFVGVGYCFLFFFFLFRNNNNL
jgi:hypothetical protein